MYLHLGASVVIPLGDVLGIFDLDNTTSSRVTRDFLARAQQAGQVVSVGEDLPKSFLLCRNELCRPSPADAVKPGCGPACLLKIQRDLASSHDGERNMGIRIEPVQLGPHSRSMEIQCQPPVFQGRPIIHWN